MIGDRFGGGNLNVSEQGDDFPSPLPSGGSEGNKPLSIPSPGSTIGRPKVSENNSPMPRDRVFVNYSYFDNVPIGDSAIEVNRLVPGFEKTFLGGTMSVEMRFPMARTFSSEQVLGQAAETNEFEFGNIGIPIKFLLSRNESIAWSTGLQVTVPTADDTNVRFDDGIDFIHVENRSVHLMPFLGALYTPNERFFSQAFLQIDVEAQGSIVSVTNGFGNRERLGELNDATLLHIDFGIGYWLYRNNAGSGLSGLAPVLEIHWNEALESADVVGAPNTVAVSGSENVESVNLVLGSNILFGQNTSLTLGYATPLSGSQREFDGEFRALFNHRFGPSNRRSRAQF